MEFLIPHSRTFIHYPQECFFNSFFNPFNWQNNQEKNLQISSYLNFCCSMIYVHLHQLEGQGHASATFKVMKANVSFDVSTVCLLDKFLCSYIEVNLQQLEKGAYF